MVSIESELLSRFRRRLVEQIAWEVSFSSVLPAMANARLAEALGVTEAVLGEAIELRRSGFRLPPTQKDRTEFYCDYRKLHVKLWKSIGDRFDLVAKRRRQSQATLTRSLLHAAMQTPYEPSRLSAQAKRYPGDRFDAQTFVSGALYRVLCRRAAALGINCNAYCNMWISDYLDGSLPPIRIVPIRLSQCFDDTAMYAVPVFREPSAPTGT